MNAIAKTLTTAILLVFLAASVSARRLATIPPGNDAGDNPHTCCRCKCVMSTNNNKKTAPSSGSAGNGTAASGGALSAGVPCVLPPNSPPGSTVNCITPTYGNKRICKKGFVGSCDEVCLVDNGGWTSYNTC